MRSPSGKKRARERIKRENSLAPSPYLFLYLLLSSYNYFRASKTWGFWGPAPINTWIKKKQNWEKGTTLAALHLSQRVLSMVTPGVQRWCSRRRVRSSLYCRRKAKKIQVDETEERCPHLPQDHSHVIVAGPVEPPEWMHACFPGVNEIEQAKWPRTRQSNRTTSTRTNWGLRRRYIRTRNSDGPDPVSVGPWCEWP